MPDWSYRTVLQPLLFSLSAETGRGLALEAMGRLSRFPFGPTIIDLLGHMRPDNRLQQSAGGLTIASPVGIGCIVDPHGVATQALSRFGIGFIEVGPIAVNRMLASRPIERRDKIEAVWMPDDLTAGSMDEWIVRLSAQARRTARYLARLTIASGTSPEQATEDCQQMIERIAPRVDGFILATTDEALRANWSLEDWLRHVESVLESAACHREGHMWLPIRADLSAQQRTQILEPALKAGCRAIVIECRIADPTGGWMIGRCGLAQVRETIERVRIEFGNGFALIAGGVQEPADAIELRNQGADCLLVDSGLIYAGPGLPKRINEAVLYGELRNRVPHVERTVDGSFTPTLPIQKMTWFWTCVLGAAMLVGGLLAFCIAATRVILPYDEVFVGMSRAELNLINPRLLAFMQHDRVTLSGTMIAVAVLYLFLSWYGIRCGRHWAMLTVLVSAFWGFVSFFLFLGFGYFDPFHAFVTAIMFQFLLMAWQGELGEPELTSPPNLHETPAWRWGQWGQLSFVVHGAVLVIAGVIISGVGCTAVFVREDLEFMDVCPGDLTLANPRLIPLIAHDRASFGGMLITIGLAVLLTALWGFREGARWQWWMLMLAGITAYVPAIGVHIAVGYTSWWHLGPAYGGLALLVVGLVLLWPYFGRDNPDLRTEWDRLRSSGSS